MSWPAACAQCTIAQIMLCVVGLKCIIVVRVVRNSDIDNI